MLVTSVLLASYAVFSTFASAATAAVWRAGLLDRDRPTPSTRARRLAVLRAFPAIVGALVTLAVVAPGYLAFEPPHAYEEAGAALVALASLGALLLMSAVVIACRACLSTWRLERAWLRSASAIEFTPPAGVPAYVVESLAPVVALIGVFSPKLVTARSVITICSEPELARIVAHERGHLHAHDNLKRWLIASAPDALRWTPYHREIEAAWYDASEDAADDAATTGDVMARVDLAALLVKIAGLAPTAPWSSAAVSPFVEGDGLDRRVRRLLEGDIDSARSAWPATACVACVCATVLVGTALSSSTALQTIHEAIEALVALGR
jgi:hypothetical protein